MLLWHREPPMSAGAAQVAVDERRRAVRGVLGTHGRSRVMSPDRRSRPPGPCDRRPRTRPREPAQIPGLVCMFDAGMWRQMFREVGFVRFAGSLAASVVAVLATAPFASAHI